MLEFAIFAITVIVLLISLVIYLYPGSRKQTSVPGLDPSHPKEGNIPDIIKSESFHKFLNHLHSKYGTIASFWLFGPSLAISISSPKLIESQNYLFEKPSELYKLFEPFVGSKSILFSEKSDARRQRSVWESLFTPLLCDARNHCISKIIDEMIKKWNSLPKDQHIPIGQYMKAFALKLCVIVGFGNYFNKNNSALIEFSQNFEICWKELEARSSGDLPQIGNPRNDYFNDSVDKLKELIKKSIESDDKTDSLLDPLIYNETLSDETVIDELMTFVLKHYLLSSALLWAIYFIASDNDLQNDLYDDVINKREENINKVINAIFSAANVDQWTSRVNRDVDADIDGHVIPKDTPIIFNLSLHKDKYENPAQLFKEILNSDSTESMAFGCNGSKRLCPAKYYCENLIKLFIKEIIKNFNIQLIDPEFPVRQSYQIISKSDEEIWITIIKRN